MIEYNVGMSVSKNALKVIIIICNTIIKKYNLKILDY